MYSAIPPSVRPSVHLSVPAPGSVLDTGATVNSQHPSLRLSSTAQAQVVTG